MKVLRLITLIGVLALGLAVSTTAIGQTDSIIISGADAQKQYSTSISQNLLDLASNVAPRITFHSVNQIGSLELSRISDELQSLLDLLPERFTIVSANANCTYALNYPYTLVGDNIPPVMAELTTSSSGVIRWTTNEFATSEFHYGTQPSIYTHILSNTLYGKSHQFTISDLVAGTTYFFVTRNTDRSGNTTTSTENSFTASIHLFLPLVIRR